MLPVFENTLYQDPIIVLELCAVLFTLFYLAKLSLGSEATFAEGSEADLPRRGFRRRSLERGFWSFFEVGSLISTPKRSLKKQRVPRAVLL